MRLLLFVSVFGILISVAVLIIVIMKARKDEKDEAPPRMKHPRDEN